MDTLSPEIKIEESEPTPYIYSGPNHRIDCDQPPESNTLSVPALATDQLRIPVQSRRRSYFGGEIILPVRADYQARFNNILPLICHTLNQGPGINDITSGVDFLGILENWLCFKWKGIYSAKKIMFYQHDVAKFKVDKQF